MSQESPSLKSEQSAVNSDDDQLKPPRVREAKAPKDASDEIDETAAASSNSAIRSHKSRHKREQTESMEIAGRPTPGRRRTSSNLSVRPPRGVHVANKTINELYDRVATTENEISILSQANTDKDRELSKLRRENHNLQAYSDKAEAYASTVGELRAKIAYLSKQIHEKNVELKIEHDANANHVSKLEVLERQVETHNGAMERKDEHLKLLSESLLNLQNESREQVTEPANSGILRDVNKLLDEPVLAAVTRDVEYCSTRSLRQELGEVAIDSCSEAAAEEDRLTIGKPRQRSFSTPELGLSTIQTIFKDEPIASSAQDSNDNAQEDGKAQKRMVRNEDTATNDKLSTAVSFGHDEGTVSKAHEGRQSHRSSRRKLPASMDKWVVLLFVLVYFTCFLRLLGPLRDGENAIWKAANEDTIGLAWISRGQTSLWMWMITTMGETELRRIPVGLLG